MYSCSPQINTISICQMYSENLDKAKETNDNKKESTVPNNTYT